MPNLALPFALLVGVACAPTVANAAESIVSQSVLQEDSAYLIYLYASFSGNPECEVARLGCDDTGLGFQLVAVGDVAASERLRSGSGVRLEAGDQSIELLPSELVVDELAGDGWIIKFGAWMSDREDNAEVVDELANSPVQLVEVSKDMLIALPTDPASLQEQRAFAQACQKLR